MAKIPKPPKKKMGPGPYEVAPLKWFVAGVQPLAILAAISALALSLGVAAGALAFPPLTVCATASECGAGMFVVPWRYVSVGVAALGLPVLAVGLANVAMPGALVQRPRVLKVAAGLSLAAAAAAVATSVPWWWGSTGAVWPFSALSAAHVVVARCGSSCAAVSLSGPYRSEGMADVMGPQETVALFWARPDGRNTGRLVARGTARDGTGLLGVPPEAPRGALSPAVANSQYAELQGRLTGLVDGESVVFYVAPAREAARPLRALFGQPSPVVVERGGLSAVRPWPAANGTAAVAGYDLMPLVDMRPWLECVWSDVLGCT